MKPLKVLILEDRPDDVELMLHELRHEGFEPAWQCVDCEAAYVERLGESLDVILANYSVPQFTAARAIHILKERGLNVPLIVITGTLGEEAAVECIKQGAADYLLNDRLARLGPAVVQALEQRRLRDEHQQTLAALWESQARYVEAEKIGHFGHWERDFANDVAEYSEEMYRIYGLDCQSCPPTWEGFLDLVHPDDRKGLQAAAKTAMETGRPFDIEFRVIRRDGATVVVHSIGQARRDESGRVVGLVGTVQNITARRQAEESLRASEASARLLGEILENSSQPFAIGYPDGRLGLFNAAFCRLAGYSPEELKGLNWTRDLTPPEWYNIEANRLEELRRTGQPVRYEKEYLRKDGARVTLEFLAHLVRDEAGQPLYYYAFVTDLTARKQTENRVAAYQRRLRSLGAKLALAEEHERRRIAADLHDDVAQGLALAKIKLQSLRAKAPSTDAEAPLLEIETLVDHAVRSTRSLLFDLSPPPLYELGLEAAVEWLAEKTQAEHKLAVIIDSDGQAKPLNEEIRGILFRAVRELLHNVVKYANARQVKIAMRREEGQIRIEVADDGVGFDIEKAPPSRDASGTGFGLFQIRERLDYVGGSIEIHSGSGCGTRVILLAPLNEGPAKAQDMGGMP